MRRSPPVTATPSMETYGPLPLPGNSSFSSSFWTKFSGPRKRTFPMPALIFGDESSLSRNEKDLKGTSRNSAPGNRRTGNLLNSASIEKFGGRPSRCAVTTVSILTSPAPPSRLARSRESFDAAAVRGLAGQDRAAAGSHGVTQTLRW